MSSKSSKANSKTWQQFLEITERLNSNELNFWFEILLTQAEKEDLKDRVEILKGLLEESLPQRELAENLEVSISKVTRGSNALKTISPQKKKWLKEQIDLSTEISETKQ